MRPLLVLLLLLAGPAGAQEPAAAPRADAAWTLSAGSGVGGVVELVDEFANAFFAGLSGYEVERTDRFQLGLRADRELGRWFRAGLAYTHTRWTKRHASGGVVEGSLRDSLHLLLADGIVSWGRSPHLEVYSGLGLGAALLRQDGVVAGVPHDARGSSLAFQLRLVGLALGTASLRAWGEVGFGFEGLVLGGVSARF